MEACAVSSWEKNVLGDTYVPVHAYKKVYARKGNVDTSEYSDNFLVTIKLHSFLLFHSSNF